MKRVWIVVCTCTLALVSAAGFAQTPSVALLNSEALAAILGPSAATSFPSCAARRGEPLFAVNKPRPGGGPKSICTATANCESGTVYCEGNSTCSAVDRDCSFCERGFVTCDGVTTQCPTACNCNTLPPGQPRWCCQCDCTGDCIACCRCGGGTLGQCAWQCG
jgi:hypothetical protein